MLNVACAPLTVIQCCRYASLCTTQSETLWWWGSHCLYVHGFRFFFTPLAGVLFAFPSRYWFTIGQSGVFSLGGWSPHIQTGYHVSRPTHRAHSTCAFVYGAVTLYRAPFQTLPLTHMLIQALGSSPFARRYWGNLG